MSGPLGRGSSFDDIMAASETDRNFFAVQLAYRLCLNREPEPDMLADRARLLDAGDSFRDMLVEIATSPEAQALAASGGAFTARTEQLASYTDFAALNAIDQNAFLVEFAYRTCLGRDPEPGMLEARVAELDAGVRFRDMLAEIATSSEARALAAQGQGRLGASCSNGEFLLIVGGLLNGRGLTPAEIVAGRRTLTNDPATRTRYVMNVVDYLVSKLMTSSGTPDKAPHDANRVTIMGTDRALARDMWDERAREIGSAGAAAKRKPACVDPRQPHTGRYTVSMIASLYQGRRFIEKFLNNVTSQSLFNESELIIIDANSPEDEGKVIAEYMKIHPNIVYERINFRIGIYEAWNRGIELARGRYLTNTNLDDLRHPESIALQASMLDRNPGVDIVYQDFFYSFDPDLDFDEVAQFGFKSNLPIICPHNLLAFNSPHNAPMWRRALHDDLGVFDTSFRSAGDYEFWARCMSRGRTFRKINTPHVVYYQNAEGISTKPNTRGIEEAHRILARYAPLLTSPTLLASRNDLEASLALRSVTEDDLSHYDLVEKELLRIGAERWTRADESAEP